jgi:acyl dehydratase
MSKATPEPIDFGDLNVGQELGCSPWVKVDQAMISEFAAATRDPDPMHIDPEFAVANGPYGGTIAFGFLTVSLLTHMMHETFGSHPARGAAARGHFLNYGMDYLRLLNPVKVDSRIRGHFAVNEKRTDDKGRNIVKFGCEVEIDGEQRPAMVAEWLAIWVPAAN